METVIVKLKSGNIDFFISLLKKLNFVSEIKIKASRVKMNKKKETPQIHTPENKPMISDFAGLWSQNPKTLEQIREKGWKRS